MKDKTTTILAAMAAIFVTVNLYGHGLMAGGLAEGKEDWLLDPSPYSARIETTADACVLDNGLVRRVVTLKPGAATVSFKRLSTNEEFVRGVSPEGIVGFDGKKYSIGGLSGQPILNYIREEWIAGMKPDDTAYSFVGCETDAVKERFPWKPRPEWTARKTSWPAKGRHLAMRYKAPAVADGSSLPSVTVHYEIYDGIPVVSKWMTISNCTGRAVKLDTFTVEELRLAEPSGQFDREWLPVPFNLHVESNYGATGDLGWRGEKQQSIHYETDPGYKTQEAWLYDGINVLRCYPDMGPAKTLAPGETFETFRVWELLFDSTEHERRGLSIRRMYRVIAPWTSENPLMFHCKASASPENVRAAIKQCVDTGFELVIMSFGSGFNLESKDPKYREKYKALADEARSQGIALGGYSLTSSRGAGVRSDNVRNPNPRFRVGPCLCSRWGREYLDTLASFMKEAGFGVFENDGPYPGDYCTATNHPYHDGKEDSVWNQWRAQSDLYRFCRANGIYVNQPDGYFLEGGNKTAGGYRETNWSLPRDYQTIIERQNVYDNSWTWNTSMHWMFVPLAQYHGGGSAATVEPLSKNLAHYELRFANLLGAGAQACWRGPRLYDSPETLGMVKKWVTFYKENRRILDGDMIHLRRADGRDWDGWMMVDPDPGGGVRAIASLFNPLANVVKRNVSLPLYYTGISGAAEIAVGDGAAFSLVKLDAMCRAHIEVEIPANGWLHVFVRKPVPNAKASGN